MSLQRPVLLPLGDSAVLVRFADRLEDDANRAAIDCAARLQSANLAHVTEIVPNLVSVLIGYAPARTTYAEISGEVRLALSGEPAAREASARQAFAIATRYGGESGPDLAGLAESLSMSEVEFIALHASASLRVLTTGFAPGFVYCGFHTQLPAIPRRQTVRKQVPAGTILFAAGQTAMTATPVPTGWHVIGRTDFSNFDPLEMPPAKLVAGDALTFPAAP